MLRQTMKLLWWPGVCNGRLAVSSSQPCCRGLATTATNTSISIDNVDMMRRGKRKKTNDLDTTGTWDTRLDVQINVESSMKEGTVIPKIGLNLVGVATHQGRRDYQEDRWGIYSTIV